MTIAGKCIVPEVSLYFASKLFRGNRSAKVSNDALAAFGSLNMPPLAVVSTDVSVNWQPNQRPKRLDTSALSPHLSSNVASLRLVPGLPRATVCALLAPAAQAAVIETFETGNAGHNLLDLLPEAAQRGVVLVNVSVCPQSAVSGIYAVLRSWEAAGGQQDHIGRRKRVRATREMCQSRFLAYSSS